MSKPRAARDYWAHIEATYGLTREMYEKILLAQQGRCAGCRCQPRKQRLGVDHSHALEKHYGPGNPRSVRGLLCSMCNHRVLGTVRDNPETMRRLLRHLEDPIAPRVLGFVVSQVQEPDVPLPESEPEHVSFETML